MTDNSNKQDLPDFDTLVAMHQEDPESLEKVRTELTNQIFDQAPEPVRRRLQGLQFRINMELRRAKTPEARCVKLSTLMHDSFAELNDSLHNPHAAKNTSSRHQAQILDFKSPAKNRRDQN